MKGTICVSFELTFVAKTKMYKNVHLTKGISVRCNGASITPLSKAKACVVPSQRDVKVSKDETISILSCNDRYLCSVCSWNVECLKYKQKDSDLELSEK